MQIGEMGSPSLEVCVVLDLHFESALRDEDTGKNGEGVVLGRRTANMHKGDDSESVANEDRGQVRERLFEGLKEGGGG